MLGLIGCGEMGTKILKELLKKRVFNKEEIIITDIKKERIDYIKKKFEVNVSAENKKTAEKADIILLAVKPQDMKKVLKEIYRETKNKTIISVAGGLSLNFYEKFFPENHVIKVMPNPFTESNSGVIAFAKNSFCKENSVKEMKKIFEPLCEKLIEIEDKQMHAFTTIASCSSAHFYYLFNALTEHGTENGFTKEKAKEIVLASANAASKEAIQSKKELKEMIDSACTPKGITIEGIKYLNQNKTKETIKKALEKTTEKSKEIEKELI